MEIKKRLIPFLAVVLLISVIPGAFAVFVPGWTETTKLTLYDASDPLYTMVEKGGQKYIEINDTYDLTESFTVYLNVTDITELRMYSVGVTYDPAILECTNFEEGEFFYRVPEEYRDEAGISTPGPFVEGYKGPGDDPAYLGYYHSLTWVLEKPGNASGSGTLAEFDFEVVGYGFTLIDIIVSPMVGEETILADVSDGDILYNTCDIIFDNTGLVTEHELLVSVEAPDMIRVGESSLLNATVYNIAVNNETGVELQLLINGTVMESETISELLSGSNYTIDYLWEPDTEATYNITAYAVPVSGEENTNNNVDTKFVSVLSPVSVWCINHPVVWDDVTYYVGTCSNATVSDLSFSQPDKQILFNLTSPPFEPTGDFWCNVSIPKVLLDAPADRWEVKSDGVFIFDRIVSWNATHTFIYFISRASPYDPTPVDVTGTIVIPEFPAAMLLLLFIIVTLVVVALTQINLPKRKASASKTCLP